MVLRKAEVLNFRHSRRRLEKSGGFSLYLERTACTELEELLSEFESQEFTWWKFALERHF